jgi:DNA-binding beta-propeller fold protein YncE
MAIELRKTTLVVVAVIFSATLRAQPPSDPRLLIPEQAPPLNYRWVAEPLSIPDDVEFGLPASVTFDDNGHLWVLNRGPNPIAEFDQDGKLLRAFGGGLFGQRPHALRLDPDGHIWVADGSAHIVVKLNQQGEVLATLGIAGQAGDWDEAAGTRLLNQPNDIAFAPNGDFFIAQGHQPGERGDPRVLKFRADGAFVKSWGGKGRAPGEFQVAHSIVIDDAGDLWVMDRENSRIQIFDQDGNYLRELNYAGLPCSIDFAGDYIWMVNGFTGQLLQLDKNGNVLAAMGSPGDQPDQFGEAHFVAASPTGEIYVADVTRGVHKFVPR